VTKLGLPIIVYLDDEHNVPSRSADERTVVAARAGCGSKAADDGLGPEDERAVAAAHRGRVARYPPRA
jgi:hypothetical protein